MKTSTNTIGYYFLKAFTLPMQLFPLEFHFLFSNFLYWLTYSLLGYRKKVVRKNLNSAFPQKSKDEIIQIEKEFYRGFADMFIETLYFSNLWKNKDKKRLELVNVELFYETVKSGRNVIIISGHFGNWEYMQLFQNKIREKTFFVYKKLNNKTFDQFYRSLRERVATPVEMRETYRRLMHETQMKNAWGALFISDQRPAASDLNNWVKFLNQDTPVMTGTERIAKKTNAVVLYLEVKKVKRGHHRATFELLVEKPRETAPLGITTLFMQRLDESISHAPAQYLWSHNRWKYNKLNN